MERCFGIMDGGTNMSTFLGVGCMKLWQLIRRKMATEIWGFVRCIPGYWSQNSTFPEDALKLSFRWDAALQDCTAFNPPSQWVSEWGGGSIETGLDVHSWLLFSRPDLDLADTAAAQCWNAWTLPALLKRHGLPNRASCGACQPPADWKAPPPPGWPRCLRSKGRRQWRRHRGGFH